MDQERKAPRKQTKKKNMAIVAESKARQNIVFVDQVPGLQINSERRRETVCSYLKNMV